MTLRFLSRGEIAEHLGVTLGTVKRYSNFPEPDVIVGRNQGWAVETVDRWVRRRVQAGAQAGRKPSAVPAVDCGLGTDIGAIPDESSGTAPTSLSTAPLGGAGTEGADGVAGLRIGDSKRRGVDRRTRGC